MQRRHLLGLAAAAVLAAGGILGRQLFAQGKPAPAGPQKAAPAAPAQNDPSEKLVAALKQSPGCLGVEVGQMKSGKLSIFAWFKDKAALVEWYYNPAHQSAMVPLMAGIDAKNAATAKEGAPTTGEAGASKHVPLEFVADGTGPILCIATITPSATPLVPGFPMAIGQISIELYQPLPGGASFGGTFAPPSVPLEHHLGDRTPPAAGKKGI